MAVKCIQASRAQVPPGKEPPPWCRSLTGPRVAPVAARQARLLRDLPAGCATAYVQSQDAAAPSALWGRPPPSHPPHGVVLLLRSWLAVPGPQDATTPTHCRVLVPPTLVTQLKVPQGASDAAAAAAGASASQTDVFRAALGAVARHDAWQEAHPKALPSKAQVHSMLEAGAFGQPDKFRGHFSFLVQCAGEGGGAPITHAADATHEGNPELTGYAAMRKHLPFLTDAFTPQRLQDAIIDCVGLPTPPAAEAGGGAQPAGSSDKQPPVLPSKVFQSDTMSSSHTSRLPAAARLSGACVLTSLEAYEQGAPLFRCEAPPTWRRRRRHRDALCRTQVVIVDMDCLMRGGAIRCKASLSAPPTEQQPQGARLQWVPEDFWQATSVDEDVLQAQARALLQQPCLLGHTALGGGGAGRRNTLPLFHGCSVSAATGIISGGFRRPICRALERCAGGVCFCQMHGMGVYFARADKALSFGKRRAQPLAEVPGGITTSDVQALRVCCTSGSVAFLDVRQGGAAGEQGPLGAVLLCEVDLGRCKVQLGTKDVGYPTLSNTEFTDHTGRWHAWEGYDSVHLMDGSLPVARKAEWCVSDPGRVHITHCLLVDNSSTADGIAEALVGQ